MLSDDCRVIYDQRKSRGEFPKVADQSDGRDAGLVLGAQIGDFDMILPLAKKDLPDGLNHFGDVNPLETPDIGSVAGSAKPDRLGLEQLLLETELGVTDNLVGKNIHFTHGRAAGRTLAALIAGQQLLAAELLYFSDKFIPDFFLGDVRSHVSFSLAVLKR